MTVTFLIYYTMYKEKKIASLQHQNNRLQLLKLTFIGNDGIESNYNRYQVRLNRKIIESNISEYYCRKIFATYTKNIILQLKIYEL